MPGRGCPEAAIGEQRQQAALDTALKAFIFVDKQRARYADKHRHNEEQQRHRNEALAKILATAQTLTHQYVDECCHDEEQRDEQRRHAESLTEILAAVQTPAHQYVDEHRRDEERCDKQHRCNEALVKILAAAQTMVAAPAELALTVDSHCHEAAARAAESAALAFIKAHSHHEAVMRAKALEVSNKRHRHKPAAWAAESSLGQA